MMARDRIPSIDLFNILISWCEPSLVEGTGLVSQREINSPSGVQIPPPAQRKVMNIKTLIIESLTPDAEAAVSRRSSALWSLLCGQ